MSVCVWWHLPLIAESHEAGNAVCPSLHPWFDAVLARSRDNLNGVDGGGIGE